MWRYIYVTWHLSLLNTGWYACSLWGVYYCYLKICHSFEKTEQRSDIRKFAVVSALLACTSCTLYWRPNCSGAPHMHNVSQCFFLLDLLSWCCPRHVLTHIWAAESPISWKCMYGQQWCVFLAALIEWYSSVYGASATCSIILRWGAVFPVGACVVCSHFLFWASLKLSNRYLGWQLMVPLPASASESLSPEVLACHLYFQAAL